MARPTEADSLSYQVHEVRPAAGSCTIVIKNTGGAAFNGTIKISFKVVN